MQEKIIVENGKIKKVKVKNKLNNFEIIERVLYFLSFVLFVLVLNNSIKYSYFLSLMFLSFFYSILINKIVIKLFGNYEEFEEKNKNLKNNK